MCTARRGRGAAIEEDERDGGRRLEDVGLRVQHLQSREQRGVDARADGGMGGAQTKGARRLGGQAAAAEKGGRGPYVGDKSRQEEAGGFVGDPHTGM